MKIYDRIKYLLQFNRQTQRELAKACKVNEATVSHWLKRKAMRISIEHLKRIATFLQVSLEELCGCSSKFDELLQRYADGLIK